MKIFTGTDIIEVNRIQKAMQDEKDSEMDDYCCKIFW